MGTNNDAKTSYNLSADLIRVIAGIAVVVIHVTTTFVDYKPFFETPSWWLANFLDSVSRLAVPLFVMLSGMLLLDPAKQESPKTFYLKRLNRVAIPVVAWFLISYIFKMLYFHQHPTFLSVLKDIISLNVYYHLYYLAIIVGLYLITPVLRVFISAASESMKKCFVIYSFSVVMIIVATNAVFRDSRLTTNIFNYFTLYVPYFIGGYYLSKISLRNSQKITLFWGVVVFSLLTTILNYWQMRLSGPYGHYFYDHFSPNVVISSIFVFIFLNNSSGFVEKLNARVVKTLKTASGYIFGIYLVHPFLLAVMDNSFPVFNVHTMHSPIWLMLVLKTSLLFLLSYVMVALGKRAPLLKHIFG
jgi:surface polysaccharide O-acyltransferase-like enzyme